MKYLKYFESNEIKQQPFYLTPGDHLYLSDEISKLVTPTKKDVKKMYKNPSYINRVEQDQIDYYNDVKTEKGQIKIRRIYLAKKCSWDGGRYSMSLSLYRYTNSNNFGIFRNCLDGMSGSFEMHGKDMKRATRECNLNFMISVYPIVGHIKNFYKIFKSKEKGFLDIIKDALDKDIMLAQYGIPQEIKHLFDKNIEDSVKIRIKYNL